MMPTRKYKGNDDMQASRRKATWFNMQKLVVNNYALGILVLRCHTPFREKRNEASIRVPRMFKSHVRPTIW
jgi:hypothetical protein